MTQMLGQVRMRLWGETKTMYRLDTPLQDCAPDWRNVFVSQRDGCRSIHRAKAYQTADGSWAPVPGHGWIACLSPLSARDLASVESAIAATHGNWSA